MYVYVHNNICITYSDLLLNYTTHISQIHTMNCKPENNFEMGTIELFIPV